MNEVFEFLRQNPIYYIATVDGEQPHVRPFGSVAKFEGNLYILTSNEKDVFQQIQNNANIELGALGKRGEWLRVTAKAIADPRREAKVHMLAEYPNLGYSPDDKYVEVLYLKDATATFYQFGRDHSLSGKPRTVKF